MIKSPLLKNTSIAKNYLCNSVDRFLGCEKLGFYFLVLGIVEMYSNSKSNSRKDEMVFETQFFSEIFKNLEKIL